MDDADPSTPYYSRQVEGLVDLNGDGIPDRVRLDPDAGWVVNHGTGVSDTRGVGYGPTFAITHPEFELSLSEGTCGGQSTSVGGLLDTDGNGKPEIVRVLDGDLYAFHLESSPGVPDQQAGRLTGISDGSGAWTRITYANNKTETATAHAVPVPEIVVAEVRADVSPQGTGTRIAPTRFAYGDAKLTYDPLLARWSFGGYRRTVALTGLASRPNNWTSIDGVAVVTDRAPFAELSAGVDAYLLGGRVAKVTRLESTFDADPRPLLTVDVETDARVRAAAAYEHDLISLPSDTSGTDGQECFGADGEDGTYPIVDDAFCRRSTLVAQWSAIRWEGTASPTTGTANVLSGSYVETLDQRGRPTRIVSLGDVRRYDDDLCTTIHYAVPSSTTAPLLSVPAAIFVDDCGWGDASDGGGTAPNPTPGVAKILAGTRFHYDDLAHGWVDVGRPTSTVVERRSDDGALLQELATQQVGYGPLGVVDRVVRQRVTDPVTQVTTYEYDRFGASITAQTVTASDLDTVLTRQIASSVWPSVPFGLTTPTGEVFRSYRDAFGRPVQDTVQVSGGVELVANRSSYVDDPLRRSVTTTVFYGDTPATTSTDNATRWARATTYLDSFARPRFTQQELGSDYGGATVIKRFALYDELGRVTFEAAPFGWASVAFDPAAMTNLPYGTTYVFDRGGRLVKEVAGTGPQPGAVQSDLGQDIYPTLFGHYWIDGKYVQRVMGPSELGSTTPSFGAYDETYTTAAGWTVASSRYAASGSRLDHVEHDYDRFGRSIRTRRFQHAPTATGEVEWVQRYDSLGQLVEQQEPGVSPVVTHYDEWGSPIETEWMDGTTRRVTRFGYDGLARLTERRLLRIAQGQAEGDAESTDFYYYDEHSGDPDHPIGAALAGRLSWSETVGVAAHFYAYDALGRESSSTVVHADEGLPYTTRTVSTLAGVVDRVQYSFPAAVPGGVQSEEVIYSHDTAGRMRRIQLQDASGVRDLLASSSIDVLGRYRTLGLGNGVQEDYDFQPSGREELKSWQVRTAGDYRRVTYDEFDPEMRLKKYGERTTATANSTDPYTITTATYDALDRLVTSVSKRLATTTASHSYAYDDLGNQTAYTNGLSPSGGLKFQSDALDRDRLFEVRGTAPFFPPKWRFGHDGAGNVVSQQLYSGQSSEQPRTFSYDSASRVRTMARGNAFASLTYGPDGALAREEVISQGSLRRIRHYGPLIEQRQRPGGGVAVERYVPGPIGVLASVRGTGSSRSIVYSHADGRANRFFTDATGQVVQSAEYQPYGKIASQTGSVQSQDYSDDLFNGGDTYSEFGVVILGARIYDPSYGRFLQRDPIALVPRSSSGNPYAFSWGDPINFSDPTGLTPVPDGGTLYAHYNPADGTTAAYIATVAVMGMAFDLLSADVGSAGGALANVHGVGANVGGGSAHVSSSPWYKSAAEFVVDVPIGAAKSVYRTADQTVRNVVDLGGLSVAAFGKATGLYSYDHEVISDVGKAYESGATKEDILWGTAKGYVMALPNAIDGVVGGAIDGDGERVGAGLVDLRGGRGQIRAATATMAGVAGHVRSTASGARAPATVAAPAATQRPGRTGGQERLRQIAADPKAPSHVRGWILQEMNSIARGQRTTIRNRPIRDPGGFPTSVTRGV